MKSFPHCKPFPDILRFAFENAGSLVGNALESVGTALYDACKTPFFRWLTGCINGIWSIPGALSKGLAGIIGGVISGILKILWGLFTFSGRKIGEGAGDIVSPVIGTFFVVIGTVANWIQTLFYLQDFGRALTAAEKTDLKTVFGNSLNLRIIRIYEGRTGLFSLNDRPFTLGNTIYIKRWKTAIELLIHETTHVWQNQYWGNRYTGDSLVAQFFIKDAYSWEKEIAERKKTHWREFNHEAQAAFIEHLWRYGRESFYMPARNTETARFERNGKDYSDIAREADENIRHQNPVGSKKTTI